MKILRAAIPVFFCFFSAIYAEDLTPLDFAKGVKVNVDNKGSLYKSELPESVYEGVLNPNFQDLRVFNSDDELVPFSIRREVKHRKITKQRKSISLPIFPLYGKPGKQGDNLKVRISTGSKGTIIKVDKKSGKNEKTRIYGYLADLSGLKRAPDYLIFEFDGEELIAGVRISGSNNLNRFSTIVSNITLADIKFGNERLVKKRVVLPWFRKKYLKISLPADIKKARISKITAFFSPSSHFKKVPGKMISVMPVRDQNNKSDYRFKLSGFFPVEKFKISLPQKNTIVNYTLLAGRSYDNLYHISSGRLYDLTIEGKRIKHDDIFVAPSNMRCWVLRIDQSSGGIGKKLPKIDIEYRPHTIIFAARGDGPFTIAYGSYDVSGLPHGSGAVIDSILNSQKSLNVRTAKILDEFSLGGEEKLLPPEKPFSMQKYILWAVLFFGVMLMGIMAYRLVKQMNTEN